MGQRMSAQKVLCFKQGDQGSQSGLMSKVLFSRCVLFKTLATNTAAFGGSILEANDPR